MVVQVLLLLAVALGIIELAQAQVFVATGSMLTPRSTHAATLLPNGMVLVTGGETPAPTNSAEIYNPTTGTWRYTYNPMNVARTFHTSTLLPDGKVLIAGGGNTSGSLASAEIFDPVAETFTMTAPMTYARHIHRAVLLHDGRVLVVAGSSTANFLAINATEIYTAASNAGPAYWTTVAPLPGPGVTWHGATLLPDGRVFVCGGYNGYTQSSTSSAVYTYTPTTDTWQTLSSLLAVRVVHSASTLNDGRVLVVGGQNNSGGQLNSAELYDPAANGGGGLSFPANPLSIARQTHTVTALPNGRVWVIGGESGPLGSIAQAEVRDPINGIWSASAILMASRMTHTSTLLPSGSVLVAGGTTWIPGGPRTMLRSAELLGLSPIYGICRLYDPERVIKGGSTIPIKVQICDETGRNLSRPDLQLRAVNLTQTSNSVSGAVEDSGNANPDSDFRFDASLGGTGGYIYNLTTKDLVTGSYTLELVPRSGASVDT